MSRQKSFLFDSSLSQKLALGLIPLFILILPLTLFALNTKTNTQSEAATSIVPPLIITNSLPKAVLNRPYRFTVSGRDTDFTNNLNLTVSGLPTNFRLNPANQPRCHLATPVNANANKPSTQVVLGAIAESCSGVSVQGAEKIGNNLYSIQSNAIAKLIAQVTPTGADVNWKIASFSNKLPNGGSFSYPDPNNTSIVEWIAPNNPTNIEQGVDIRGDISEYPNPWKYCPTITFAIKPGTSTPPTPTPTPNVQSVDCTYSGTFTTSGDYSIKADLVNTKSGLSSKKTFLLAIPKPEPITPVISVPPIKPN